MVKVDAQTSYRTCIGRKIFSTSISTPDGRVRITRLTDKRGHPHRDRRSNTAQT